MAMDDNSPPPPARPTSLGVPSLDHTLADHVAALTETPLEAEIDARMGLRGAVGHAPTPEDFADVLSPEGDSGDVFGAEVTGGPSLSGEDGSTRIPPRSDRDAD